MLFIISIDFCLVFLSWVSYWPCWLALDSQLETEKVFLVDCWAVRKIQVECARCLAFTEATRAQFSACINFQNTFCSFFSFWVNQTILFKISALNNHVPFKGSKGRVIQSYTVKLGIKELLNKEQTGFKKLFTDYQPFYIINLLLNKDFLPI